MSSTGDLYVGTPSGHDAPQDERTIVEADDLTTHGVIVGMTGSGKTGLGIIVLEEALLSGIPTLVLDPKGDMANLCLTFPDLAPADFRPWIDEAEAQREGRSADEEAQKVSDLWTKGLAGSGLSGADIGRMREQTDFTVYTPGATTGIGINLVGSLSAPPGGDPAAAQDEVSDIVTGLLSLIGVESDPLTGREHILLTNLITHAWAAGESLDLPGLIARVQQPPIRKLGVIDLETFYPAPDRMGLALRLNGMLASPTFAAWTQGQPLDIQQMLYTADGKPRCAIVSLAHLDDSERQFVVTLVLSRMISWMRAQSGTSSLRALIYMDEVFGFVPPVANPPAKQPILTILKQARAFGIGMILSTQNPVDLDYKAISNAGTWMIGRLQTERDKDRLLEGMRSASGAVDIDAVSAAISGLDKRQFVLHSTRGSAPSIFGTRWAMSYLRGPLTGPQIATLMEDRKAAATSSGAAAKTAAAPLAAAQTTAEAAPAAPAASAARATATALADDESTVAPTVPDEVAVRILDPAAEWADSVGVSVGSTTLAPHVAVRVRLTFDEKAADLDHTEEFEAVMPLPTEPDDLDGLVVVDYDDRDLRTDIPDGAVYVLPDAKIHTKTWWRSLESAVKKHMDATQTETLHHNPTLKLYSRPGESFEDFGMRCDAESEKREDEEAEKLRKKMEAKADRLRDAMARAQDRVAEIEESVSSKKSNELINIGTSILGGFLGGRKSARGVAADLRRAAGKRGQTRQSQARLDSAERKLADASAELVDLEQELGDELFEIDARWMEAAKDLTTVEVGLETSDIVVEQVALLWVPVDR